MGGPRVIVHVDLDAFYASVEVRDNPALRGKPVVVGGRTRGVVLAASYEARKYGVRSALPMTRALRLCPQAVVIAPRMSAYAAESDRFFDVLSRYSPLVEGLSLDEAFLDLTGTEALLGETMDAVRRLRAEVREKTGLACSAGVAPTKSVAKLATDLAKPDGQIRVPDGGVREFLAPLKVGRLWGVGPKTEQALVSVGIRTIGDLQRAPEALLHRALGGDGSGLRALALGEDPRPVVPDHEAKSIGAEETFEEDLDDLEAIETHLLGQAERVASRLRRAGVAAGGVTLKYKLEDFRLVTRQKTLAQPTSDGPTLFREASALLRANVPPRPIRLCGVTAHALGPPAPPGLFDRTDRKQDRLNDALDRVREKYGRGSLVRARLLDDDRGRDEDERMPGDDRRRS